MTEATEAKGVKCTWRSFYADVIFQVVGLVVNWYRTQFLTFSSLAAVVDLWLMCGTSTCDEGRPTCTCSRTCVLEPFLLFLLAIAKFLVFQPTAMCNRITSFLDGP